MKYLLNLILAVIIPWCMGDYHGNISCIVVIICLGKLYVYNQHLDVILYKVTWFSFKYYYGYFKCTIAFVFSLFIYCPVWMWLWIYNTLDIASTVHL